MELSISNVFSLYDVHKMDYSVCEEFVDRINAIEDKKGRMEYVNDLLKEENKYTTMFEQKLYLTQFFKRLDYVLALMNDCGYMEEKHSVHFDYHKWSSSTIWRTVVFGIRSQHT